MIGTIAEKVEVLGLSPKPHSATYSLEDDKLRLYPAFRLPKEDYERVKEAGFIYAPKQGLFVQVWSPAREDVILTLADDIEDENTTVAERAEAKARRLETLSSNADRRAEGARDYIEKLTDGIPFGQPILVGHHSEKKARKDAERIQRGMDRAVDEMKKADYWKGRAVDVLRHAVRHERPDVIFRRIAKLEADLRKHERAINWSPSDVSWAVYRIIVDEMKLPFGTDYDDLTAEQKEQVQKRLAERKETAKRHEERWIEHLHNRIEYEKALYEGSGGIAAEKTTLEIGGAVMVFGKWREILKVNQKTVSVPSGYSWQDKVEKSKIKHIMTKAEYEAYRKSEFLPEIERQHLAEQAVSARVNQSPKPWEALEGMKVEVVSGVDDLFPTPNAVIDRMFAEVSPSPDGWTLEPSAGTGAIAKRLLQAGVEISNLHLIEKNGDLANALSHQDFQVLSFDDFMEYTEICLESGFRYSQIYMNPPFSHGQDVLHVMAAYNLLDEDGRMVAIMSEHAFFAGDRQSVDFRTWLESVCAYDIKLPSDAFKESGTGVQTRMIVIHK